MSPASSSDQPSETRLRQPESAGPTKSAWLHGLGSLGDRADDSEQTRLQHRFLVYMAVLMSGGGLIWGTLALVFLTPTQSIIPYGYVAATIVNLAYFRQSKNFAAVRFIQILLSLLLPVVFQAVLGGFQSSGAVMLWAMLAVVGSLTFSQPRAMAKWLVMYAVFTVFAGLTDHLWRSRVDLALAPSVEVAFFVINIVVISAIVFGLTLYFLVQRERALTQLASANAEISGLRKEVNSARRLGQYTLIAKLGEGGMGAVYRARHAMLRRPTAVKLVRPEKVGEETLARFEREVQHTSQLTHPNTVTIFDYGRTADGTFYYAMELLEGANLRLIVEETGPMQTGRTIHVLRQAAAALVEAHAEGLIHRDVKPANIILTEMGRVADVLKLVDFGLVKNVAGASAEASVTFHGSTAGTPAYMSPEAISDPAHVGTRSDIYALGCVGYFLLTGEDVFSGRTVLEVCGHHLHSTPEPLASRLESPIPPALERVVMGCLSKDVGERPDAETMVRSLEELQGEAWGQWSQDVARDWWATHGERVRTRDSTSSVDTGDTVLQRVRSDTGADDDDRLVVRSTHAQA